MSVRNLNSYREFRQSGWPEVIKKLGVLKVGHKRDLSDRSFGVLKRAGRAKTKQLI